MYIASRLHHNNSESQSIQDHIAAECKIYFSFEDRFLEAFENFSVQEIICWIFYWLHRELEQRSKFGLATFKNFIQVFKPCQFYHTSVLSIWLTWLPESSQCRINDLQNPNLPHWSTCKLLISLSNEWLQNFIWVVPLPKVLKLMMHVLEEFLLNMTFFPLCLWRISFDLILQLN